MKVVTLKALGGLDEIADAFRHQESGRHFGKTCLEY